jgi:acyl dehydratase
MVASPASTDCGIGTVHPDGWRGAAVRVDVGLHIPEFRIPLTVQRLVMEAAANRDFAPIHHDREITRTTGTSEPYANTMLIQAILEATVRQWMGLDGKLRKLSFSMRSFAPVGATLSGHGKIVSREMQDQHGLVELEVWTQSNEYRTAIGTATVWLPNVSP